MATNGGLDGGCGGRRWQNCLGFGSLMVECGGGMAHIALEEEFCWCFQVDEGFRYWIWLLGDLLNHRFII